jgi:hypothetical protein
MQDNEELAQLIFQSEFLMEGLDKCFWRFVKLSEPEIWGNEEDYEPEYVWVVAVMGNYCIVRDETHNSFRIGCYETHGEITTYLRHQGELHYLILEILNSRYIIS